MIWIVVVVMVICGCCLGIGITIGAHARPYNTAMYHLDDEQVTRLRNMYGEELVRRRRARKGGVGAMTKLEEFDATVADMRKTLVGVLLNALRPSRRDHPVTSAGPSPCPRARAMSVRVAVRRAVVDEL